ncbi:MAG: rhodanese-like domain-containing protein [Candidatus Korobacteraceae bacterium]
MTTIVKSALILAAALLFSFANAEAQTAQSALPPGSPQLIHPEDLVKTLQARKGTKPLIFNVGPYLLYVQAHIPGSEYLGTASTPQGLASLRDRVKTLSPKTSIVLYCGCCPWTHCPNVAPAYAELQKLGFSNVKVLYIANNIGIDWVDKGYPILKGQ